jgi:hypothetical protein
MKAPDIQTAVPVRRYVIGDYSAVLLHQISSRDKAPYYFILALVPFGGSSPTLYIAAQKADETGDGPDTVIRVIAESGERAFGPDDRWRDLDMFAEDALQMAVKVLHLAGEEVRRLL